PPELPSPAETAAWSQADRLARFGAATPAPAAAPSPQARTSAFDRELKGPVFAESSGPGSSGDGATAIPTSMPTSGSGPPWAAPQASNPAAPAAASENSLTTLLRPSVTPAVEASILPTERFLLPKGAFIDCTR